MQQFFTTHYYSATTTHYECTTSKLYFLAVTHVRPHFLPIRTLALAWPLQMGSSYYLVSTIALFVELLSVLHQYLNCSSNNHIMRLFVPVFIHLHLNQITIRTLNNISQPIPIVRVVYKTRFTSIHEVVVLSNWLHPLLATALLLYFKITTLLNTDFLNRNCYFYYYSWYCDSFVVFTPLHV